MFFNEALIGHWVNRTKMQKRMWLEVLADVKPGAWNKMKAGILWPLCVICNRRGTPGGQATLLYTHSWLWGPFSLLVMSPGIPTVLAVGREYWLWEERSLRCSS